MTKTFASLVFAPRHGPVSDIDWERISLALQVLSIDHNALADATDLLVLIERAYNVDVDAGGAELADEFNDIARGLCNAIFAMARRRITLSLSLNYTREHVAAQIVEAYGAEYAEKLTWAIIKLLESVEDGAEADED